jgi:hypothetical protein
MHTKPVFVMHTKPVFVLVMGALATCLFAENAGAQSSAVKNVAGTYRCEPEPVSCQASGQTFTVTQSGTDLELKNDQGLIGRATMTSNISLSAGGPWNMLGVVVPDGRIQWSNGTAWRKQ